METNDAFLRSGVGQSMWQVIVGRVISGSGGAGMMALAAVIITGESAEAYST